MQRSRGARMARPLSQNLTTLQPLPNLTRCESMAIIPHNKRHPGKPARSRGRRVEERNKQAG